MDDAFLRRFNSVVRFPFPSVEERKDIWKTILPADLCTDAQAYADELSSYELSGGNIVNVVQAACLRALSRQADTPVVDLADLQRAVKQEIEKEGKVFKPAA